MRIEVDRHGTFLRLGRVEVYARWDRTTPPSLTIDREPGAVEVMAGRFRLTVSKVPPQPMPVTGEAT
jgi:hypothetical protein